MKDAEFLYYIDFYFVYCINRWQVRLNRRALFQYPEDMALFIPGFQYLL